MLLIENYNYAFEFVKVIIQNIVNPDIVKMAFLMTSQLRQHYVKFSIIFVKWSLRMIHSKSYENRFKSVKVMHGIL